MSWWGFLSESCKCAPYRHHNSRHFDKLATEGSSDSVLQEGQEHVPPATVLPLVSESEPLLIKPEPKAEIKAITLLDERPIYAINLTEQSNADGTTVGSDNQKLTAEWLDAKLKIMSLTKPMYICASVQLLAEGLLLGPGLFNLVDWALAALGACSCLLVLTSCCTLLETGLFYAILLNLLAVVLEFIPIGNFIAAGVEHTDRRGVFGIFPGFMLSWRFALGLAAYEFVVVLIRVRIFLFGTCMHCWAISKSFSYCIHTIACMHSLHLAVSRSRSHHCRLQ